MIGKKIIETEAIPSARVKEILDDFSQDNELNYEQNLTLNHLARFKKFSAEDSEEIMEKLPVGFMEDVNLEQDIIYDLGKKYNNKDVTVLKYAKTCYTYVLDYFRINFWY